MSKMHGPNRDLSKNGSIGDMKKKAGRNLFWKGHRSEVVSTHKEKRKSVG